MSEFDEWFKEETGGCSGAQGIDCWAEKSWDFQQAKIQCMEVELVGANERTMMMLIHKNAVVDKMQAKIDNLQGRIDETIREINEYYDSDGMSDLVFLDVATILKGKEDED